MSAYFVAGTGTGIGKTFTTCALLHAAQGHAKAYKPVVSGFGIGDCDNAQIIAAQGTGAVEEISPWRFAAPLSPDMAAAKEGRKLTSAELVAWTKTVEQAAPTVLVETVGGLMVPLNARETTCDWMAACALPLILVAGSYLGALSHTLTAIDAARHAGLHIAALVINESACDAVDLAATQKSIAEHARIPLILAQPRVASYREATVIHGLMGRL